MGDYSDETSAYDSGLLPPYAPFRTREGVMANSTYHSQLYRFKEESKNSTNFQILQLVRSSRYFHTCMCMYRFFHTVIKQPPLSLCLRVIRLVCHGLKARQEAMPIKPASSTNGLS